MRIYLALPMDSGHRLTHTHTHADILTEGNTQTLGVHLCVHICEPQKKGCSPAPVADSPSCPVLVIVTSNVTIDVTLTFLPFPK